MKFPVIYCLSFFFPDYFKDSIFNFFRFSQWVFIYKNAFSYIFSYFIKIVCKHTLNSPAPHSWGVGFSLFIFIVKLLHEQYITKHFYWLLWAYPLRTSSSSNWDWKYLQDDSLWWSFLWRCFLCMPWLWWIEIRSFPL